MSKNMKITDMCIYVDTHVYEWPHDVETIFNYIKTIFYALAVNKKLFHNYNDYEGFSLYAATRVYLRVTNKKQFLPDDDPRKIKTIKSILNYAKGVMHPFKVDYEQEMYRQLEDPDINNAEKSNFEITTSNNSLLDVEIRAYFQDIPKVVKQFINHTPYSNDPEMRYRLYISCLITLLRSLTLSNENQRLLNTKLGNEHRVDSEQLLARLMKEEQLTSPCAWHLDTGMSDYIYVITNNIRKLICKDINEIIQSYQLPDAMIEDILYTPYKEQGEDIYD